MQNTAVASIDLAALRHNLQVVRRLCPRSRIMAVIKANAYGHGLLHAARALAAADGFAVARLQEAHLLRESGISQRILLLATLLDEADMEQCSKLNIDVVVHEPATVTVIAKQANRAPLKVWLKHDSGMHRAGIDTDAFIEADRLLSKHPGVLELVHMTHFSSAADQASRATMHQLDQFSHCHSVNENAPVSLANSAALICRADTRADWVRPGIMLYGDNPLEGPDALGLRAAMRLTSYVIAIRHVATGESVGYDCTWTATRNSRIGTIGIGYGDGYPRHARSGTPVWINGRVAPLIGRVSMDSITIDLTDCGPVQVGDEVVLWGPELPVATIARHAGTISYHLLASLQARVTRNYIEA
jgi:alanine racemase